jgi:hypothetical protein
MKSITSVMVIALLLIAPAQVTGQQADEAAVQAFVLRLDQAIAAKNATEVGKLISENAEFSGTVTAGGRTRTLKVNKTQYVAGLREMWMQASNYMYRRTNQEIAISGSKATVTADVFESMIVQGQYVQAKSKEFWTLEKINGAFLVTGMVAKGTMRGAQ